MKAQTKSTSITGPSASSSTTTTTIETPPPPQSTTSTTTPVTEISTTSATSTSNNQNVHNATSSNPIRNSHHHQQQHHQQQRFNHHQRQLEGAPGPPYYVDLHVNAGECVSLQLLDGQDQVVAGPATITMVSQQPSPPVPIPVQVPPGHMIHQIADENGTLKHIILSLMNANQDDSSQLDSSALITLPQGVFRIDSHGELVSVAGPAGGESTTSQLTTLPQQAYFANYNGCPVATYEATVLPDSIEVAMSSAQELDRGEQANFVPAPNHQPAGYVHHHQQQQHHHQHHQHHPAVSYNNEAVMPSPQSQPNQSALNTATTVSHHHNQHQSHHHQQQSQHNHHQNQPQQPHSQHRQQHQHHYHHQQAAGSPLSLMQQNHHPPMATFPSNQHLSTPIYHNHHQLQQQYAASNPTNHHASPNTLNIVVSNVTSTGNVTSGNSNISNNSNNNKSNHHTNHPHLSSGSARNVESEKQLQRMTRDKVSYSSIINNNNNHNTSNYGQANINGRNSPSNHRSSQHNPDSNNPYPSKRNQQAIYSNELLVSSNNNHSFAVNNNINQNAYYNDNFSSSHDNSNNTGARYASAGHVKNIKQVISSSNPSSGKSRSKVSDTNHNHNNHSSGGRTHNNHSTSGRANHNQKRRGSNSLASSSSSPSRHDSKDANQQSPIHQQLSKTANKNFPALDYLNGAPAPPGANLSNSSREHKGAWQTQLKLNHEKQVMIDPQYQQQQQYNQQFQQQKQQKQHHNQQQIHLQSQAQLSEEARPIGEDAVDSAACPSPSNNLSNMKQRKSRNSSQQQQQSTTIMSSSPKISQKQAALIQTASDPPLSQHNSSEHVEKSCHQDDKLNKTPIARDQTSGNSDPTISSLSVSTTKNEIEARNSKVANQTPSVKLSRENHKRKFNTESIKGKDADKKQANSEDIGLLDVGLRPTIIKGKSLETPSNQKNTDSKSEESDLNPNDSDLVADTVSDVSEPVTDTNCSSKSTSPEIPVPNPACQNKRNSTSSKQQTIDQASKMVQSETATSPSPSRSSLKTKHGDNINRDRVESITSSKIETTCGPEIEDTRASRQSAKQARNSIASEEPTGKHQRLDSAISAVQKLHPTLVLRNSLSANNIQDTDNHKTSSRASQSTNGVQVNHRKNDNKRRPSKEVASNNDSGNNTSNKSLSTPVGQLCLLNLSCASVTSSTVQLRWSYSPSIMDKFGLQSQVSKHLQADSTDHFVVECSSVGKNLETNCLISAHQVYQGNATTCKLSNLSPERIHHFRVRRTALTSPQKNLNELGAYLVGNSSIPETHDKGGDYLIVSEILSVSLSNSVQPNGSCQASTSIGKSSSKKINSNKPTSNRSSSIENIKSFGHQDGFSGSVATSNVPAHNNPNQRLHAHPSSSHHNYHLGPGSSGKSMIKSINSQLRTCRNRSAAFLWRLLQTTLSGCSDTKFAGLLIIMFTVIAMLLAIFIHMYIVPALTLE